MPSVKWVVMKPMKRLINQNKIIKITLQSLPILLVAIVFVIYALSFLPYSEKEMKESAALVECKQCIELKADGHAIAWIKCLTDSLTANGISAVGDTTLMNSGYTTACWVNRYPFWPSCQGRMITADASQALYQKVDNANQNIPHLMNNAICQLENKLKRLQQKSEEVHYYLSVHNVSDVGYNTIAALEDQLQVKTKETEKALKALEKSKNSKHIKLAVVQRYTLFYTDSAGKQCHIACNRLTPQGKSACCLLQTASKATEGNAQALSLHKCFTALPASGKPLLSASFVGCQQYGYNATKAQADLFEGKTEGHGRHNIPPLLCPDGSPLFTKSGHFVGINIKGNAIEASQLGFGLKELLP